MGETATDWGRSLKPGITKVTEDDLDGLTARHLRWPVVPFTVVLTFVVLTLVFILAEGKVTDPDVWWHLHNADYLIRNHSLPRYDMYSFSASGHPWINHEWLSDLPYYFAWRALGLSGIEAITLILLSLIYLGIVYLAYQESSNYKAAILATACAIFLGRVSFGPRTILFGYAFLVLLLIILQRFRLKGRAPLWIIPPLFCVWVNTHGSWSLGMIFFSIIVGGGLFRVQWGLVESQLWSSSQRQKLLLTWVSTAAFLFLNPYGAKLVFYPLDLAFHQKTNIEHVAEWVSVNFHDFRGKMVMVFLLAFVLSTVLRPRRWSLTELVITLFALYSGLTYVRFLFLTGLVLAPVVAQMLDFIPPYRAELDTPVLNTIALLLMITGIVHYWPSESQLRAKLEDQYPVGAIAYLQAHAPTAPVFNYYLWGGFINWKDPQLKVFVDGRADIFDYTGVFTDYLALLELDQPDTVLDKYKARYILFPHEEPFTYLMEHDPKWKTVYTDKNSVLLERNPINSITGVSGG